MSHLKCVRDRVEAILQEGGLWYAEPNLAKGLSEGGGKFMLPMYCGLDL